MDLTYNIRRLISPIADVECGTKELEIRALDNLDERYLIRTKDGDGNWLNFLKSPLSVEKLCSSEKGVVEVTVRKEYPKYRDSWKDFDKFLKDVGEYFCDTFGEYFVMTVEGHKDKADASRWIEDIGWEYYEVDCCVGWTFTLDCKSYSCCAWEEEKKTFILRKLEAIFDGNVACCNVEKIKEKLLGGELYHYEFCIDVAS